MANRDQEAARDYEFKPRMSSKFKIFNATISIFLVGGYMFFLFYNNFVPFTLQKWDYISINYTFILIGCFYFLQTVFALGNNLYYVPKIKSKADRLPIIGIQVIGMNENPQTFTSTLVHLKNLNYPNSLIRRIVVCIDGYKNNDNIMLKVFKEVFPDSMDIELKQHFGSLPEDERQRVIEQVRDAKYLVITQPHGGRREVKYTAFCFSSLDTEYVFHCDSDTWVGPESLQNMAKTAMGYNKSGKLCGAVVGRIEINNVFNYLAMQMEICYWYAFYAGRASQSLFGGVTTVSGAFGLYESRLIREIAEEYREQYLCGFLKINHGQDRHLTSKLIQRGTGILFDSQAQAQTDTPLSIHGLITQQTRWFIGFYRQNYFSAQHFYDYDLWAIFNITYQFFLPFLVLINLFYIIILDINKIIEFMIYIFVAGCVESLRIMLASGKFKYFHCVWYPAVYYFIMLPSYVWSFLNLVLCIPENEKIQALWKRVLHAYLFIVIGGSVIIGIGFIYNLVVSHQKITEYNLIFILAVALILFLLAIHWMTWGWIVHIPQNKKKLNEALKKCSVQSQRSLKFLRTQSTA